jgi:pilus assembly protein CpaB
MRAVSVRVNEIVSVAGFVTPGTRVDVLLTGTPTGGTEPQTTTVLKNVAVIAAGPRLERSVTGEAQTSAVITLLVSPDDAQRLTLASAEGHIQLSLRNPLDTRQDEVAASNEKGLYQGMAAAAAAPPPVRHIVSKKKTEAPATPAVTSIEVYQGDKKPDVVNCSEENCTSK